MFVLLKNFIFYIYNILISKIYINKILKKQFYNTFIDIQCFFMNSYIKKFIYISLVAVFNVSICKEIDILSLPEIHALRSDKLKKSRLIYSKKNLLRLFSKNAIFLVNGVADMANRVGCDQSMQTAIRGVLGKKTKKFSNAITAACESKNREK